MKKAFISASIPYVNGAPHIGHALELVQTDVLARTHRMLGYDTLLTFGTDENAQKNIESAEKAGVSVEAFVEKNSTEFAHVKDVLNISIDRFVRTSSPAHRASAQKLWQLCQEDIYKKSYTGLYCVGCETFYREGECPDNVCPLHHRALESVTEENYFFRLSRYERQIAEAISTRVVRIEPSYRMTELLNFIGKGLEDFSISRPTTRVKGWGIPVPGDDDHRMYVWFDALVNYLTALGFGGDEKDYDHFWKQNPKRIHVIGKDIIKFHAIYWIGMLLSAKILLPTHEYVHGFLSVDGQKMSKSLGNVISPAELVRTWGVDPVRYYLLREIPSFADGDFSASRMREVYDSDLANELGNLLSRVTTLAASDGIQMSQTHFELDEHIADHAKHARFDAALTLLWERIKVMNREINTVEPWKKTPDARREILTSWLLRLGQTARDLTPFMPETAEAIRARTTGLIQKHPPLFPRITSV